MATIGLKNPEWDLNKGQYPETDELFLMKKIEPILMILAVYLLFVMKVGPSFMRKRPAYKLTNTLLVYNFLQVGFSAYLVQMYFRDMMQTGLLPKECFMTQDYARTIIIDHTYLYFIAKMSELLDTIFFVLRKKDNQVTFLHLYHHTVMCIGTFAMLKYSPSHLLVFIGFINSFVHVFMYAYYGLAALGPHMAKYLTWKKYITVFQLVQFILIIFQYLGAVKTSDCPPSKGVATFIFSNTFFFFILFFNFYLKSYKTPKKAKPLKDDETDKSQCLKGDKTEKSQ